MTVQQFVERCCSPGRSQAWHLAETYLTANGFRPIESNIRSVLVGFREWIGVDRSIVFLRVAVPAEIVARYVATHPGQPKVQDVIDWCGMPLDRSLVRLELDRQLGEVIDR